ncbi:MAG TPA: Hsp20/alpha crystallin family protein, partial [Candidatus Binatia bacterium]|nr:Hsp20/alpha crystallin family protein [Candidatus Binatia bacterium]
MAQLLLESWRQALSRLRDDVQQALGRWLPRRQTDGRMAGGGRPPMRWGQSDQQFGTELDNVLDLWSPWWRSLWGEDLRVPSLVSDGGPKIDVEETDDEVIVVAELPGLDKEHFTVEVRGNRLILRGEQRQETEE